MEWLIGWLLALNAIAFAMTWEDKRRARRKGWRIPERRLMLSAALGGAVGLYLGCRVFRHKINHPKFMVGIPLILVLQIACGLAWYAFRDVF